MEKVIQGMKKDFDREIIAKVQRIRNQLQAIIVATQEIAIQLAELVESFNSVVADVRAMEAELNRIKKEKKK